MPHNGVMYVLIIIMMIITRDIFNYFSEMFLLNSMEFILMCAWYDKYVKVLINK